MANDLKMEPRQRPERLPSMRNYAAALIIACLGAAACSSAKVAGEDAVRSESTGQATTSTGPRQTTSGPPAATTATTIGELQTLPCGSLEPEIGARSEIDSIVQIALLCGDELDETVMVDRVVPASEEVLSARFTQLLLGVTPTEAKAGFVSSFSSYTAGQFESITIRNGVVTIDLSPALIRTNNFSTSQMSNNVFTQIRETIFAVPDATGIEFTVEGDRWCGWESGPCEQFPDPLITRDSTATDPTAAPEPAPANDAPNSVEKIAGTWIVGPENVEAAPTVEFTDDGIIRSFGSCEDNIGGYVLVDSTLWPDTVVTDTRCKVTGLELSLHSFLIGDTVEVVFEGNEMRWESFGTELTLRRSS